jgi:hypothetical protein
LGGSEHDLIFVHLDATFPSCVAAAVTIAVRRLATHNAQSIIHVQTNKQSTQHAQIAIKQHHHIISSLTDRQTDGRTDRWRDKQRQGNEHQTPNIERTEQNGTEKLTEKIGVIGNQRTNEPQSTQYDSQIEIENRTLNAVLPHPLSALRLEVRSKQVRSGQPTERTMFVLVNYV